MERDHAAAQLAAEVSFIREMLMDLGTSVPAGVLQWLYRRLMPMKAEAATLGGALPQLVGVARYEVVEAILAQASPAQREALREYYLGPTPTVPDDLSGLD